MFILALAARLLLSVTFAVAGAAKLADLAGSRRAMIGFGVPNELAGPLGTLLPIVELAAAVLLLPAPSVWIGAWTALFLLGGFVAAIAINLAMGRKPDCHCFGQLHSEPAGWSTLIRNALLAGAAALLVVQTQFGPQPSLIAWFGALDAPWRALVAVSMAGVLIVALQIALLWQIVRQQGRILVRLEAIEARTASGDANRASRAGAPVFSRSKRAPEFELQDLNGRPQTLRGLLDSQKPLFLLFVSPNCGPCQALLPEVVAWAKTHSNWFTFAIVSEGAVGENRAKFAEYGQVQVLLQRKREVAENYEAWGTPAAVLVGADGFMAPSAMQGADAIRALMTQSAEAAMEAARQVGHAPASQSAQIGRPMPAFELPSQSGPLITTTALRGRDTLILFWNPACGFCKQMLPDLQQWDKSPPLGAPELVVISSGSGDEAKAMALRSDILLDPENRVAPLCGAHGTPMAVLVNSDAKIASPVAAGAAAVFALAQSALKQPMS